MKRDLEPSFLIVQTDDDDFGVSPRQGYYLYMICGPSRRRRRCCPILLIAAIVSYDTCQDGAPALAHISPACNCSPTKATAFAAYTAVILQVEPPIAKANRSTLWL